MEIPLTYYHVFTLISHTLLVTNTFYLIQFEDALYIKFLVLGLVMISTLSLYKISSTNPGCITGTDELNKRNLLLLGKTASIRVNKGVREIFVDGDFFEEKFCSECNVFQNSRVKHCYYCESCILEADHHCAWLDTCITRYNMTNFLWLLHSTLGVVYYNIKYSRYMMCESLYLLIMGVGFILLLFLTLYFWILIFGNIKSSDFIKKRGEFRLNPKESLRMLFGNRLGLAV